MNYHMNLAKMCLYIYLVACIILDELKDILNVVWKNFPQGRNIRKVMGGNFSLRDLFFCLSLVQEILSQLYTNTPLHEFVSLFLKK